MWEKKNNRAKPTAVHWAGQVTLWSHLSLAGVVQADTEARKQEAITSLSSHLVCMSWQRSKLGWLFGGSAWWNIRHYTALQKTGSISEMLRSPCFRKSAPSLRWVDSERYTVSLLTWITAPVLFLYYLLLAHISPSWIKVGWLQKLLGHRLQVSKKW